MVKNLRKGDRNYQAFLYLDSLRELIDDQVKAQVYENLTYLGDYSAMDFKEIKVPQQPNDHDCGLFLLRNIHSILNNPDIVVKASNGDDIEDDLFLPELSRKYIEELIDRAAKYKN